MSTVLCEEILGFLTVIVFSLCLYMELFLQGSFSVWQLIFQGVNSYSDSPKQTGTECIHKVTTILRTENTTKSYGAYSLIVIATHSMIILKCALKYVWALEIYPIKTPAIMK